MRPRRIELQPHALEGVLAVVHERVDRSQPLEQGWQLFLAAPEDQRPALLELRRNQPAGLRAGRDAGAALAFVESPRHVVAADFPREIDRMQMSFVVRLEGE